MCMTIENEHQFSSFAEINSTRSSWNCRAKIIRLWQTSNSNRNTLSFSIEMVLMDSYGGRIHATIVGGSYDTDFLIDVIGILIDVGREREINDQDGTPTKVNVIEIEQNGSKIQCYLYGAYVDVLNAFLGAGHVQNVVVVMMFAKVVAFQGKIHIQNCLNSTYLSFNPF
ncbi:DNA helicase [Trifolium repens]|nr:DNA helicase [Trifolium repens]